MSLTAEQVIEVVEEACRQLAIEREQENANANVPGVDMFGLGMQYTIQVITNRLHALSVQEQYKERGDEDTEG